MRRAGKTTNAAGQEVTLHEAIYDYDNLLKSYNKARRGKRYRKEVLRYTRKKEENIQRAQDELRELTYNPSGYRYFKVYEPNERQRRR